MLKKFDLAFESLEVENEDLLNIAEKGIKLSKASTME